MPSDFFMALVQSVTLAEAAARQLEDGARSLYDVGAGDIGGFLVEEAHHVRGFHRTIERALRDERARRAAARQETT